MHMKCIEQGAVLIMMMDFFCVTCDRMYRHGAQIFHNDNRYPPLAYRKFSPMDAYTVPMQEQIYHIREPSKYLVEEPPITDNSNSTYDDTLNAVNDLDNHHEHPRTANYRQGLPNYFTDIRGSDPHKHGHKINTHYAENAPIPVYTATRTPPMENKGVSVSFLKPDWNSLTKSTEIAGMDKWSGLLQLILSFITGSMSGNLEFKGFKDTIVSTLLKPILATKGDIKSFISKITIPLLSLLLINVEVLVTVWWLWEDCPKEMKMESVDVKSANNYTYV